MGPDSFTMLEPITKIIKLALTAGARRTVNSVLILLFSSGIKIQEFPSLLLPQFPMQFTGFQSNKFVRLATFRPAITFTSVLILHNAGVQLSTLYKRTFEKEVRIMKDNTYLVLFVRKSTATEDIFSFSLQKFD